MEIFFGEILQTGYIRALDSMQKAGACDDDTACATLLQAAEINPVTHALMLEPPQNRWH